jgi:hypothetical protein
LPCDRCAKDPKGGELGHCWTLNPAGVLGLAQGTILVLLQAFVLR